MPVLVGSQFQWLTNIFFLIFHLSFPHYNLSPLSFILLLCTSKKSLTIFSVTTHYVVKIANLLSHLPSPWLSLLFFTLNQPCCFSICSCIMCSRHPPIVRGSTLLPLICQCLFYCGQPKIKHTSPAAVSWIMSFILLARLLLIQPRMLLAFSAARTHC